MNVQDKDRLLQQVAEMTKTVESHLENAGKVINILKKTIGDIGAVLIDSIKKM